MTTATTEWFIPDHGSHVLNRPSRVPVLGLPRPKVEIWEEYGHAELLEQIERLSEDWDGGGASKVETRAIANARDLLTKLHAFGLGPDTIAPNPNGTVEFEWGSPFGSANLEIGRTRFSFYTAPVAGACVLKDGAFDGLVAQDLYSWLLALRAQPHPVSVAYGDKPLGDTLRYAASTAELG